MDKSSMNIYEKLKDAVFDHLEDLYGIPLVNKKCEQINETMDEHLKGFRGTLHYLLEELESECDKELED